jgi:inositol-phosphate phosphatase/L-galactose 1-phosphate phosphatase/histidinol-phosphatase
MTDFINPSETLLREDVPGEFMELAVDMVNAARAIALRHFRADILIENKADNSPVTIADREAESAMRALINKQFPDHGILGEEHGHETLDAKYVWVLDPIDGTVSFATGFPTFGILAALVEESIPIIGMIDVPVLNDRWVGARGRPTTLNGVPVSSSPCTSLEQAWISASSPFMFTEGAQRDSFDRLRHTTTRRPVYSGNCLAYGLLSSGHLDIVCEADMGPYDYMAVVDGTTLATGDPALHDQVLAILGR